MNQYIKNKEQEFEKAIEFFKKEISTIRTGRANPAILNGVQVEAYGVKTPLNGLASVTVPDASSLLVSPWDKNVSKDIEKAISEASLGLGISNEGGQIRLSIPKMTEENRKNLVKILNDKQEEARISIRHTRDEIKSDIEEAEKEKEITEDDKFAFIKELDERVTELNNELKKMRDEKEKDIMTI